MPLLLRRRRIHGSKEQAVCLCFLAADFDFAAAIHTFTVSDFFLKRVFTARYLARSRPVLSLPSLYRGLCGGDVEDGRSVLNWSLFFLCDLPPETQT